MATPWRTLDRAQSAAGELELRQRGEREFLITLSGRVLMNSHHNRSELALAELACRALAEAEIEAPQVLIGGLGMGCTLRAALDVLSDNAKIHVSELNPVTLAWCADPLAELNGRALEDPRVHVEAEDVAERIATHASQRDKARLNAIILDLYEGPQTGKSAKRDPFFGSAALDNTRRALARGGLFAAWSEAPDKDFEARLKTVGFDAELKRPGRGGLRHAVYLARRRR